ncbi:hypothetical protein GBA52_015191 [Prunus armeniaca]|nr:hypothetical protein GBA52_015191 [Prunus armeniaca]
MSCREDHWLPSSSTPISTPSCETPAPASSGQSWTRRRWSHDHHVSGQGQRRRRQYAMKKREKTYQIEFLCNLMGSLWNWS